MASQTVLRSLVALVSTLLAILVPSGSCTFLNREEYSVESSKEPFSGTVIYRVLSTGFPDKPVLRVRADDQGRPARIAIKHGLVVLSTYTDEDQTGGNPLPLYKMLVAIWTKYMERPIQDLDEIIFARVEREQSASTVQAVDAARAALSSPEDVEFDMNYITTPAAWEAMRAASLFEQVQKVAEFPGRIRGAAYAPSHMITNIEGWDDTYDSPPSSPSHLGGRRVSGYELRFHIGPPWVLNKAREDKMREALKRQDAAASRIRNRLDLLNYFQRDGLD